jgi:hypothetical protein
VGLRTFEGVLEIPILPTLRDFFCLAIDHLCRAQ